MDDVPKFHEYRPNLKQTYFHKLKFHFRTFAHIGSWRSGKSLNGCAEVLTVANMFPGIRILIGRANYKDLRETTIPMLRAMVPDNWVRRWNEGRHILDLVNGSQILFRGFDRFKRLGSLDLGMVWIEEAAEVTEVIFDALVGRLSQKNVVPCLYLTCNHDSKTHWIYKKLAREAKRIPENPYLKVNEERGFALLESSTKENIDNLPEGYIDETRKVLTPEMASIYLDGLWGTLTTDQCYYAYDINKNTNRTQYDPNKELHISLDFNVNPMTMVIVQERPLNASDVESHVIDEIVLPTSNTHELMQRFGERYRQSNKNKRQMIHVHGDATCNQMDTRSGTTDRKIVEKFLYENGFSFENHIPGSGINPSIRNRLNVANARLHNAQDIRRIFVNDDKAPTVSTDLQEVSYASGKLEKDKSNSDLTHASDALDYYIWDRFKGDLEMHSTTATLFV